MVAVRSHVRVQITWIAVMDLACLVVGSVFGVMARLGPEELRPYVFEHVDGWLLFFGSVLLANYLAGSYRVQYTFSRFNLLVTWVFSLIFAVLIVSMTSYAWFRLLLGRGVLVLSISAYSFLALFLKLLVYRSLFRREVLLCRSVILGTGARAVKLMATLEREYVLPAHKVIACVRVFEDEPAGIEGHASRRVAVVDGTKGGLEDLVRSLDVSLIVVGLSDMRRAAALYPALKRLRFEGIEVLTPLSVAEIYSGLTPLDLVNENLLMQASMESGLPVVARMKRVFDIVVSLLGCIVFLPLGALLAALIKLSSPRDPVFYVQTRVGQFGRTFKIYKLRTMTVNAEEETGPVWAAPGDRRITRVGRLLRRFRLDEIPQVVNILKGEMSIVGPRPERPEIVAKLTSQIRFYAERDNIMPGLTGWAQIRYPYGNTIEDAARKLEFDLYYMKHVSLSLDIQIILSTLRIVLLGREQRASWKRAGNPQASP